MRLKTDYLGIELSNPVLIGASPLVYKIDTVKRLEEEGAAGLVMHSLFEEQIVRENVHGFLGDENSGIYPEAGDFPLHPEAYLEQLQRLKEAVSIPVIASLNGIHLGTWSDYARMIESAGADAVEVNLFFPPSGDNTTSQDLESAAQDIVRAVSHAVNIPVAVKLGPFYAGLTRFVTRLTEAGARAVVLFNSFYQPELDLESMTWKPYSPLKDHGDLSLRTRWLATLYGRVRLDLCMSGGIRDPLDAIKALAAGATAVQVVSAVLGKGDGALRDLLSGMERWLDERRYHDIQQLRGTVSFSRVSDTAALGRAGYLRMLQSWNQPD